MPTESNTSDGVSRLDQSHVSFLLESGWTRAEPENLLLSLDEKNFVC